MADQLQSSFPNLSAPMAAVRRAGGWLLDVVIPAQCLGCETIVDTPGSLCASCWPRLRFIDRPYCDACGVPFDFDVGAGAGALCPGCIRDRPEYDRGRSAVVYDDGSRRLILALKYGDRTDAVRAFARWMARAGSEVLADADVLVPVPLHWTRLFRRRYNQSALIAHALGKLTGVEVAPDLLIRTRRTPPLGTLGASRRVATMRNVIALHPRRRRDLSGCRVVVIDDVHTTGATLRGCSRALLKAGAQAVDVLTVARTVHEVN